MPRMRTTWIRYFLNWLSQAPFTLLINTTTLHVISKSSWTCLFILLYLNVSSLLPDPVTHPPYYVMLLCLNDHLCNTIYVNTPHVVFIDGSA